MQTPDQDVLFDGEAKELCWFLGPSEAKNYMKGEKIGGERASFMPVTYPLSAETLRKRPDYVWAREQTAAPSRGPPSSLILTTEREEKDLADSGSTPDVPCTNGACLPRKEESKEASTAPKSRWVSPPKTIFNPTIKVSSFARPSGFKFPLVLLQTE